MVIKNSRIGVPPKEKYMTEGRKTTQEERAEIVEFCIEHRKDYGLTVETYKVSYQ